MGSGDTAGVYSVDTDGSNLKLIYNEAGEDDFEGVAVDGKNSKGHNLGVKSILPKGW